MYDSAARQIAVYEEEIQRRMQEVTPAGCKDIQAPPLAKIEKQKTIRSGIRKGNDKRCIA